MVEQFTRASACARRWWAGFLVATVVGISGIAVARSAKATGQNRDVTGYGGPTGFVVYCFDPSQGKNSYAAEPVPMLREVPSGKAVPLFKGVKNVPFSATVVLSIDPTGRYVLLRGIPNQKPVPAKPAQIPAPPFWLWVLDLKTSKLTPLPGRTLVPTTDDQPGYHWSEWCSDAPVLAVNINDFRGNRLDLWDMRTGRIRTVGADWIKSNPGQMWPDQDHIWTCAKGVFLDAFWDFGRTNRLSISALGSENWQASWFLKPHWDAALRDMAATPDARRFAATIGSEVLIAERGKKLRALPVRDIQDLMWSHDGRKLAGLSMALYDRATLEFGCDIDLINLDSGHLQSLAGWGNSFGEHDNDEHMLAWSLNDHDLIGWTGLTGYPSYPKLWSLDVSTKKETVLWDSKDTVTSFAWHEGSPRAP
jgi:hypothetical protein